MAEKVEMARRLEAECSTRICLGEGLVQYIFSKLFGLFKKSVFHNSQTDEIYYTEVLIYEGVAVDTYNVPLTTVKGLLDYIDSF